MLINQIFDKEWLNSLKDKTFQSTLKNNYKYRKELEKWFVFFNKKGWINQELIKRLRNAKSWGSFYSKVNELRAGYVFENFLNFNLTDYEKTTKNDKNVEFKGIYKEQEIYIEVKTAIEIEQKGGGVNYFNLLADLLSKATKQLPNNMPTIVVLSEDLGVSLFDYLQAKNDLQTLLNSPDYENISAVCLLGNVYFKDMYKYKWYINHSAKNNLKIEKS